MDKCEFLAGVLLAMIAASALWGCSSADEPQMLAPAFGQVSCNTWDPNDYIAVETFNRELNRSRTLVFDRGGVTFRGFADNYFAKPWDDVLHIRGDELPNRLYLVSIEARFKNSTERLELGTVSASCLNSVRAVLANVHQDHRLHTN